MKVYTSNWHGKGILSRLIEAEDQSASVTQGKPSRFEVNQEDLRRSRRCRESLIRTRFGEGYVNANSRRWQSMVPRRLPNLRSSDVTSLKHDHLAVRLSTLTSREVTRFQTLCIYIYVLYTYIVSESFSRKHVFCQIKYQKCEKNIIFFKFSFVLSRPLRVVYVFIRLSLHQRISASLSGRKPRTFGSYMKYEGKSHWMRIVRPCRWNQSQ